MRELQRRADALARAQQRLAIGRLADELTAKLKTAVVEATDSQVVVRGRGLLRRWLADPALRFLTSLSR